MYFSTICSAPKIRKMDDTVLAGNMVPMMEMLPESVASLELLTEEFRHENRPQARV
jgi:hypothetical protein